MFWDSWYRIPLEISVKEQWRLFTQSIKMWFRTVPISLETLNGLIAIGVWFCRYKRATHSLSGSNTPLTTMIATNWMSYNRSPHFHSVTVTRWRLSNTRRSQASCSQIKWREAELVAQRICRGRDSNNQLNPFFFTWNFPFAHRFLSHLRTKCFIKFF